MSTLWDRTLDETWRPQAIEAGCMPADSQASRPFGLASFGQGTDRNVALLVIEDVPAWINGHPVVAGLKVLAHQDEIQVGRDTWYFSSESPPMLTTFQLAAEQRRPRCGVCRMAIEDGDSAVVCPRCGRVCHQLDAVGERPAKHCFTYRDRCLCGHPTALDGEAVWRPDEEDFHE